VEPVNPDKVKEDILSIEGFIRSFTIDLDVKKEFVSQLAASLVLKTECLGILRASTIPIVILGEYRAIKKEIVDTEQKLKQTKVEVKNLSERLIGLKLEHNRMTKLLKSTEPAGGSCGKLLKFERTKTSKRE
jgi:hypothetical protein